MPLLWKSRKKRKPKRSPTPPDSSSNDNTVMDLPPEEDKDVVFAIIIQDFTAGICDELSVHRGQIIQPLFNNGTWLYVKNVDGKCGYVPANFCQTLDQVKDSDGGSASSPRKPVGMSRSIHELVEPRLHSSTGDSQSSSPAVAHLSRRASSPAAPTRLCDESLRSNGKVPMAVRQEGCPSSQSAAIKPSGSSRGLNASMTPTSPVWSSYHMNRVLHPLHPHSFVQQHEVANGQSRQSSNCEAVAPPLSSAQSPNACLRNYSYKQAVVSVSDNLREERQDFEMARAEESQGATRVASMAHQPAYRPRIHLQPLRPSTLPLYDRLEGYQQDSSLLTTRTTTDGGQFSFQQSELVDDVFLPTVHKPVGIFKATASYAGSVEGEVSVRGNEYVIVTNLGCGEWAMVITAGGKEGLLPRSILSQYQPMNAASSVATQTELVIVNSMAADSANSYLPSRRDTVVCIREVHSNHSQTVCPRNTNDMCIQTEPPAPPSPLAVSDVQDWVNSQPQSLDDLWYENSMSLPRLGAGDDSLSYLDGSGSIHTLPAMNGLAHEHGTAPRAYHSSRESLPQLPFLPSPHPLQCNGFSAEIPINNVNGTPTNSCRHHYLDAMVTPTAESDSAATPPSVSIKPQMVTLVSMKDFVPSLSTPNCLMLKKGDILYLYPGNNVQKGWIWAYHTGSDSYGFVPKTYVAFMYPSPTAPCRPSWQNNHFVIEEEV